MKIEASNTGGLVFVGAHLPRAVHERLAASARQNCRSMAAEMRFALQRAYNVATTETRS